MAKEKPKYKRGSHPNSLANLKTGKDLPFKDREKAKEAQRLGVESHYRKRSMRELAEKVGAEEQVFTLPDGTPVTMSKLEIIVRNFFNEARKNPNHKNITALIKMLGEDEQHISVDANVQEERKYDDIEVTEEMRARATAILMQAHIDGNK